MRLSPRRAAVALAVLLAIAASGCAKKPPVTPPVPPATTQPQTPVPTPTTPAPAPAPAPEPAKSALSPGDLQIIHFAYDSFTLDDAARHALDSNAKLLRDNAALSVSVDGHADERGTVEYNQALGQKRAEAAQQYLIDAGIAATRFRVI